MINIIFIFIIIIIYLFIYLFVYLYFQKKCSLSLCILIYLFLNDKLSLPDIPKYGPAFVPADLSCFCFGLPGSF